jgi:hypothetical protein
MEDANLGKKPYNPATVKTVLSVIQREHEAENDRIKYLTTKVQVMLTTSSILLTATIFLLQAITDKKAFVSPTTSIGKYLAPYCPTVLSVAILIIISAIIIFLYVLMTKSYRRIAYEKLVYDNELIKEPQEVESGLVATYEEALKGNIPVGDKMMRSYRNGSVLVMIASVMLFLVAANSLL